MAAPDPEWACGLLVSTTGLAAGERRRLQALIEAAGGGHARCSTLYAWHVSAHERTQVIVPLRARQLCPRAQPALHAPAGGRRPGLAQAGARGAQRRGRALGHAHRAPGLAGGQRGRARAPAGGRVRARACRRGVAARRACRRAALVLPGDPRACPASLQSVAWPVMKQQAAPCTSALLCWHQPQQQAEASAQDTKAARKVHC